MTTKQKEAQLKRELLRRAGELRRINEFGRRRRQNPHSENIRLAEDVVHGLEVTVAFYSKAMKVLGDY